MTPFFDRCYGVFDLKMRVIVRFNGDGQGDKFRYQVDTRWVLLLGLPLKSYLY